MQEGNTIRLFALFMTPEGPKVDVSPSADRRALLRMLDSACEDLREVIAVDRIRQDIVNAAKAAEDARRIQVVPANGVPKAG